MTTHPQIGSLLLETDSYLFNPFCLPPFAVAVSCLVLGVIVLRRGRNPVSVLFMLLSACLSIWFLAFTMMYSSARPEVALVYARIAYLGVPFIPAAALHFMTEAFPPARRREGRLVWVAWVVSGVFSSLAVGTERLLAGTTLFWWGYYVRYGWLSVPFIAYFVGTVAVAFLHGRREQRGVADPGSEQYRRGRVILAAYLIAGLGMVDFLPKFGVPLYPFGYLPFYVFLLVLFRNVSKTGLAPISPSYAADSIIATMSDGLVLFDAGGVVRFANPAFCALFGLEDREVLGRPMETTCARIPDAPSLIRSMQAGPLKDHEVACGEGRHRRVLSISSAPLRGPGGHLAGTVCIGRDVTERERAGQALRESEERYRGFLESFRGIVYRRTLEQVPIFVHGAVQEITGYTPEEIGGDAWNLPSFAHPEDRELVVDDPRLRFVPRFSLEREYRIVRKDSALRWIHEFLQNVVDESGRPAYVQGIILDVTDRRHLEEQLQHAQKMESIGRLAGGMAHDFNNLLTSILGYSELLLESEPLHDPQREQVGEIQRAAKRAAALTGQLLAFSRKQVHNPRVLDTNELLLNMQRLLRPLIPENIALGYDLAPQAGNIKADPGQVEQIILNLVVNAVDAMENGGQLRIVTAPVDRSEILPGRGLEIPEAEYVRIGVEDNGHGIPAALLDKIFEPFFTTKERGKGTGLGLSTVYGLVKQSAGYVDVRSRPGEGSSFSVYLPRVREEPGSSTPDAEVIASPTPQGRGRILFVEDEGSLRRMLCDYLVRCGYQVTEAGDGRAALERYRGRGSDFDLLVTDVVMPGVGGAELASALVRENPSLQVLYISGYAEESLAPQGLLRAGVRLLQKPFSPRTLEGEIRGILSAPPGAGA
ncbi:MAG: PAS domain S-box protein [Spirochaetales bacterium]|nr:PAS domain S-box protein [Spirochaetales bacterium]